MSDLRFAQWNAIDEDWDAVDTTALGISGVKVARGNSHPARATFTMTAPNHSLPFEGYRTFLAIWDEGAKHADGTTDQSVDIPLFEGWVHVITPGGSANEVEITAYDPSFRAALLTLMNLPWTDGVTPNVRAYPRVTYNAVNDAADDYALSRAVAATIGEIVSQVMDDHVLPLRAIFAAPPSGDPYDATDIADLTLEPQSTVTGQSETLRSFCERVLSSHDPAIRMMLEPGTRKWRFQNMKEAPEVTVTLNDPANATGMVLSCEIQRSAEGRFGAIEIYGPPTREWADAVYGSGGTDTMDLVDAYTAGTSPNTFTCWWKFEIVDPDYTAMVRKGPYPITVNGPVTVFSKGDGTIPATVIPSYISTPWAVFTATFQDNDGGSDIPSSFSGWQCDARAGIVSFGDTCICRLNPTGTPKIEPPESATFHYPRLAEPLMVRVPESGFEGTAYTVGGLEEVLRIYDESLAVGYEYGNPVSTMTRIARFEEYAAQLLEQKKDLIYAGGMTLEGMQYEFCLLNRRVNLAALDDDGDELITGWEEIGALVSDVEYDFAAGTTTLQFSSDQLEALSIDPEQMKERLKIRPAEKVFWYTWTAMTFRRPNSSLGFIGGDNWNTSMTATVEAAYVDEFGEVQ